MISCSCKQSLSNIGGAHCAKLRTANPMNAIWYSLRSSAVGGGRITFAWRVVSLRYGSTLTMNSSSRSAASSAAECGVESTGLPPTVTIARIWPSPGVVISSARPATGNSLRTSGYPRTRLWRRPMRKPRPRPLPRPLSCGVSGNIAPPGESRFPVTRLRASTAHAASVPKPTVCVPIRP